MGGWGGGFILVANSGTNGLLRTAGGVMEAPSLSWSDLSSSGTGGRGTPLPLEKKEHLDQVLTTRDHIVVQHSRDLENSLRVGIRGP